jgi:hypothetical protein
LAGPVTMVPIPVLVLGSVLAVHTAMVLHVLGPVTITVLILVMTVRFRTVAIVQGAREIELRPAIVTVSVVVVAAASGRAVVDAAAVAGARLVEAGVVARAAHGFHWKTVGSAIAVIAAAVVMPVVLVVDPVSFVPVLAVMEREGIRGHDVCPFVHLACLLQHVVRVREPVHHHLRPRLVCEDLLNSCARKPTHLEAKISVCEKSERTFKDWRSIENVFTHWVRVNFNEFFNYIREVTAQEHRC